MPSQLVSQSVSYPRVANILYQYNRSKKDTGQNKIKRKNHFFGLFVIRYSLFVFRFFKNKKHEKKFKTLLVHQYFLTRGVIFLILFFRLKKKKNRRDKKYAHTLKKKKCLHARRVTLLLILFLYIHI